MSNGLDASERAYRIVDVLYRLHHDLFQIENLLTRTTRLQLKLARISNTGRMGVFAAGLLAIVPVLISLGDITWGSAPAITIYCLAGAVVLLWIYQVLSSGDVGKELATLESYTSTDALEDRLDFVLEEMNAWVVRHRMVDRILREIAATAATTADETSRSELQSRERRFQEILESCESYVKYMLEASSELVAKKKRSQEDHEELVDWAAAIPGFAP